MAAIGESLKRAAAGSRIGSPDVAGDGFLGADSGFCVDIHGMEGLTLAVSQRQPFGERDRLDAIGSGGELQLAIGFVARPVVTVAPIARVAVRLILVVKNDARLGTTSLAVAAHARTRNAFSAIQGRRSGIERHRTVVIHRDAELRAGLVAIAVGHGIGESEREIVLERSLDAGGRRIVDQWLRQRRKGREDVPAGRIQRQREHRRFASGAAVVFACTRQCAGRRIPAQRDIFDMPDAVRIDEDRPQLADRVAVGVCDLEFGGAGLVGECDRTEAVGARAEFQLTGHRHGLTRNVAKLRKFGIRIAAGLPFVIERSRHRDRTALTFTRKAGVLRCAVTGGRRVVVDHQFHGADRRVAIIIVDGVAQCESIVAFDIICQRAGMVQQRMIERNREIAVHRIGENQTEYVMRAVIAG